MAERKFDYTEVGDIYNQMLRITGDSGSADSIAGILHNLDEDMKANVNVSEMAIYGSLANQLLLDWENSSSNFPSYVAKFGNWATVIAQSAGDYSEFEKAIAGFKDEKDGAYLGAASGGIHDNYINTSYYNQYQVENYQSFLADVNNMRPLYQLTGATYATTDSESILNRHKIATYVVGGLDILGLLWTGMAGYGLAGATPAAGTDLVPVNHTPTGPTGTTGAPQLTGGNTPLLPGSSYGAPIKDFSTRVALTQGRNEFENEVLRLTLDAANRAEQAGATFASMDQSAPNIIKFFNALGKAVGQFNGATGIYTPL